jgi:hypothetical protein
MQADEFSECVEPLIVRTMSDSVPGLSIAVVAPGGIVWQKGFGVADIAIEHLGGGAGFFNVMRLHPSARVGVIVMGNATSYDYRAIIDTIVERYGGGSPTLQISR